MVFVVGVGAVVLSIGRVGVATADVNEPITPGGPAVTVTLAQAGEIAYLTFSGSVGQRVSVRLTNVTIGNSCCGAYLTLRKPDGSPLGSILFGTNGGFLDTQTLPVAGTYTLVLDPEGSFTGSATVTLYDVPLDPAPSMTATSGAGSSETISTTTPGQNIAATFAGTVGQRVSVKTSNVTIGNSCCGATLTLRKPDGSPMGSILFGTNGGFLDTQTLPVAGTYTLFLDPQGSNTGNVTVTLYDVPADPAPSMTATSGAGTSETISTTTPGQNIAATFAGTVGQRVSVKTSNVTIGNSCCGATLTLRKPDGSPMGSILFGTNGGFLDTQTLPVAGTYTLFLDPQGSNTGNVTVTLYDVPADPTGTIVIGGAPSTLTTMTPGQNGLRTFIGSAGQTVQLTLTNVTIGNSCCGAYAQFRNPDGTNLGDSMLFGTNGTTVTRTVNVNGQHSIFIDPVGSNTGSATLTLTQTGAPPPATQPPEQTYGTDCKTGHHAEVACGDISDPINTLTGAFTTAVEDLAVPGTGVSFGWTRTYTSADPTVGRLGLAWTDSYATSLTVLQNGDVRLRGDEGQQVLYTLQGDGSFDGAPGARSKLSSIAGGYKLVRHDQVVYEFTSQGRLTSMKDRNNQGLTFTYDGNGKLTTVTDAAGRQATVSYNADNLVSQVSIGGRSVSYAYTSGRLTSVTDVRGKVWTYTYDGSGRLATVVDPLNHTQVTNVYGGDGRVTSQTDALGKTTTFAWDQATQTATVTDANSKVWKDVYVNNVLSKRIDPLNNETRFAFDSDLNETAVTGPTSQTTTMGYDANGNLLTATAPASLGSAQKTFAYNSRNDPTSITDARGKVTSYGYDSSGNNTSVTQDGTTLGTYTYDSAGRVLTFTDGNSKTTTYTYDANGNTAAVTNHLGEKTTFTYDAAGRVLTRVDPRGNCSGCTPADHTWSYTYNPAGQLLTETNPLGHVTTHTYDDAGNELTVTDPRGKITTYTYDNADRLLTITAPDGGVTTYTYDNVGNKLTEKDPLNHTTTYTYDSANRLASVTKPSGGKTTFFYDANGNLIKQVEPRGNVQGANPDDYDTLYTYDAAGRLLTETDPLGSVTTHVYDAVGNETQVTDAAAKTTTYAYDGKNRLSSVTAPDGGVTSYTYDNAGNLLTRTDGKNHTTTYAYDGANRRTSVTSPTGQQWTTSYDPAGNVASTTDANGNATPGPGDGVTSYAYDRAGRLTTIDYADTTPDVSFAYDAAGNRTQMTDSAGTQTRTYDDVNRLLTVTRGTDVFTYEYDLTGNLKKRVYPAAGGTTDYTFDVDDRLATVVSGGGTTSYGYDAAGNLVTTTLPSANGYVETRVYDRAGRLTELKTEKAGSVLAQFVSTLDAVGNPTRIDRTGSLTETQTNTYDNNHRLTSVCFQASCPNGTDPKISWTYDLVGNRLTEQRTSGTTNYTYNDADQLLTAGSTSYSYDQNGNQLTAGSSTATWDLANRLKTLTQASTTTTYSYDGDGNRLQASTGTQASQKTNFVWDLNHALPQLAMERNGAGTMQRRYIYGLERIRQGAGTVSFYHYDALGSVIALTDSNGATQRTYSYEPYGSIRTETGTSPTNFLNYTGEYLDPTGLYHLRARQYDPTLGRFLSTDPANQSPGGTAISRYGYTGNRPTLMTDPSGRWFIEIREAESAAESASSPVYSFLWLVRPDTCPPPLDWDGHTCHEVQAGTVEVGFTRGAKYAARATGWLWRAIRGGKTAANAGARPIMVASDGTEIVGFTRHGINRAIGDGAKRAGVTPNAVLDAIKNPTKITQGMDQLGRPFKVYLGTDARVIINPQTGRIVSINPRSGAGANR